jgi:exodeoxyribonuclease-3
VKVATWNLNSIRMRLDRLVAWLEREKPDVLCLQETKVEDSQFPTAALEKLGYQIATFGQRGYNGVAILSTQPLDNVQRRFVGEDPQDDDADARVIAATTHGMRIVCLYVPNGQELTSDKYPYKLAWFGRLRAFLDRHHKPDEPLIVCGDMNVTPDDRDVWSPEKWKDHIHCSEPERQALVQMTAFGLVDLFRDKYPDARTWSWWDYRGVSFFKDQGLRIDVIFGTKPIAERVIDVRIDRNARKGQDASDHAPVIAELR